MPTTTPPTPRQPLSPWTMTPARLTIVVLGFLAVVMIAGAIMGGVANMEVLKEAASSQAPDAS